MAPPLFSDRAIPCCLMILGWYVTDITLLFCRVRQRFVYLTPSYCVMGVSFHHRFRHHLQQQLCLSVIHQGERACIFKLLLHRANCPYFFYFYVLDDVSLAILICSCWCVFRNPEEADAQSTRAAVLLDELDYPGGNIKMCDRK